MMVEGAGDITVKHGHVNAVYAKITGAGDIRFYGDAQEGKKVVQGAGDIYIKEVKKWHN